MAIMAAHRKAHAPDVISLLMQRYEEEQDMQCENENFHLPTSFLAWIFTILPVPDRDPASDVLREVARRCRLDWQDILSIAKTFRGSGQAKNVLECVSQTYGEEVWRCTYWYSLIYSLCQLHHVLSYGNETLVVLVSSPIDLYKNINLTCTRKPLLHVVFARCSSEMLKASLKYEHDEEELQRSHALYREILRAIVRRDDFDPDAKDAGGRTAAQIFTAESLSADEARAKLHEFVQSGEVPEEL